MSPAYSAILVLVVGAVAMLLLVGRISEHPRAISVAGLPFAVIAAAFGLQAPQPVALAVVALGVVCAVALLLIPVLEPSVPLHVAEAGALLLLGADAYADVEVDAQLGNAVVHVVHRERKLAGEPGELISLFAILGPASGVLTEGLVYPLRGETLEPGSSRGLSNAFAASEARVRVDRGVLLAVRPSGNVTAEGSSRPRS